MIRKGIIEDEIVFRRTNVGVTRLMRYDRVTTGTFIERPSRFIAMVEINGIITKCHVKNTGRCKELLVKGSTVVLQESNDPDRKTRYDVIAVYKGELLINMDSQIPNAVVEESISKLGLIEGLRTTRREVTHGDSRFDIYAEGERECFIEVKGVTLENDGIAMFPDAPTERGLKHVEGLIRCVEEGYDAYIIFVIQMKGVKYFTPNYETHPEFGYALKKASENGVRILAYDCNVTESSIVLNEPVEIRLNPSPTL